MVIVRLGPLVCFGVVVGPSMHVYLCDAKGSELHMGPLIEEPLDKTSQQTQSLWVFNVWMVGFVDISP